MHIFITDSNSPKSSTERFNVLWEVATKKRTRLMLLRPLMGLVLVIVGIITEPYESFKTVRSTFPSGGVQEVHQFNLHLALSLGIVFIIYSSFDFWRIRREKFHFLRLYNKRVNSAINLELTDEVITQDHFGIKSHFQWTVFSNYVDTKGFLFLVIDDSPFSSISINKQLLSEDELAILIAFLSEKKIPTNR